MLLTDDHCIQGAAVDRGTTDLEHQLERMVSQGKLTWIIPANLVSRCIQLLVQRGDQSAVDIDIELAIGNAAFIEYAEGLSGERQCYCRAILRCLSIGPTKGFCCGDACPA